MGGLNARENTVITDALARLERQEGDCTAEVYDYNDTEVHISIKWEEDEREETFSIARSCLSDTTKAFTVIDGLIL